MFGTEPIPTNGAPGMNTGYYPNPFAYGQFGSYFNSGGGVPPASSGFRYRDKRGKLGASLKEPGADKDAIQGEIDTLDADRNSYIAHGAISGGASAAGNIFALVRNNQALNHLENANPNEYVPQELRDVAGAAGLAANSASVSDRGQRMEDINRNANEAFGNAQLAAQTPEQLQQAAIQIQKAKNNAINDMGREGQASQRDRRRYADATSMKLGESLQNVKNNIEATKADIREAQVRNLSNLFDNLGTAALMMV